MTLLERVARYEHGLRPLIAKLPPQLVVQMFSRGRTWFLHRLEADTVPHGVHVQGMPVTAWNLTFQNPIWNAAGMFKSGGGYPVVAAQGAGAYVAGTTTARARKGNTKRGVQWPAAPYPHSKSASNWMGLPNPGHTAVATVLRTMPRVAGCPVGASISADPSAETITEAVQGILDGMKAYSLAGVDYLELNESCPNVPGAHEHGTLDVQLLQRLEMISDQFLRSRYRPLPVVVKFSTDVLTEQIPNLIRSLVDLGYDGVVFGNTSISYAQIRPLLSDRDKDLFDFFRREYGGGVSGAVLSDVSLQQCTHAVACVAELRPAQEFHVIRCGGIFSARDVHESMKAGVVLHQWYTGYFEAFALHGHGLYQWLSSELASLRSESSRLVTLS